MDIEVRLVEGCPNAAVARQRLDLALHAVGRGDIDIRLRVVRTDAEAAKLGFTGSPTILIDGSIRSSTLKRWRACPAGCIQPLKAWPARRASSS